MAEDILYHSNRSTIRKISVSGQPTIVSKEFIVRSPSSDQEMRLHAELSGIGGVLQCFVCSYGEKPVIITEFCGKGSIRTYFESLNEPISEKMLLGLFQAMQRTVVSLHRKRVGHANIEATNWLLTDNIQVKLTDFGHAVQLPDIDIESPIRNQFTLDSSQLACVFYQMATCDFSAEVLNLPESAVQIACAERGYSRQVSNIICSLLSLRAVSSVSEAAQTPRNPEEPIEDILSELEEIDAEFPCCCCYIGIPAVQVLECGQRVCVACEQLMRERGIRECSICASNGSSPGSERTLLVAEYEFPAFMFSQL